MRRIFLLAVCSWFSLAGFSQSPRAVLIEHFTNTRCSICASRNPGFYSVLANYPQVLHIAYHPSAPYSQCYFSLQNKTENDARTNYYNTYGSTPDYFLNGKILPAANPAINNTTLDTALGKTSPVEITATEELMPMNMVSVRVVLRTTGANSLPTVRMFAGVAEEPVNYNAPNGDNVHHDVFRKALTLPEGNQFALPMLGDSSVFTFTYEPNQDWNINNIYTLVLVQRDDTKEVLNAAESNRVTSIPNAIQEVVAQKIVISPNPAWDYLKLSGKDESGGEQYTIFDLTGRNIQTGVISDSQIQIENLAKGVYFLNVADRTAKFIKD